MKSKSIIYIGLLFLLFSLPSEAADTLRIHVVVKHLLNSSGLPYKYRTITQQFHTPDGVFFREINYSDSTGELSNYSFLFYKDNKLLTREFYDDKNNLQYILHHRYDENGNLLVLTRFVPTEKGGLAAAEKYVNTYKANLKVQSKHYTGKKIDCVSRFFYDAGGNLQQEVIAYKKAAKGTKKEEIKVYSFNEEGKTSGIIIKTTDLNGTVTQRREEMNYKDGLLVSVKLYNNEGNPVGERIYKYLKNGKIAGYEEINSRGIKSLMLQYEYKKNFMEAGVQKSKYENL